MQPVLFMIVRHPDKAVNPKGRSHCVKAFPGSDSKEMIHWVRTSLFHEMGKWQACRFTLRTFTHVGNSPEYTEETIDPENLSHFGITAD